MGQQRRRHDGIARRARASAGREPVPGPPEREHGGHGTAPGPRRPRAATATATPSCSDGRGGNHELSGAKPAVLGGAVASVKKGGREKKRKETRQQTSHRAPIWYLMYKQSAEQRSGTPPRADACRYHASPVITPTTGMHPDMGGLLLCGQSAAQLSRLRFFASRAQPNVGVELVRRYVEALRWAIGTNKTPPGRGLQSAQRGTRKCARAGSGTYCGTTRRICRR